VKDKDSKLLWEAYGALAQAWEKGLAMQFLEMWHDFYKKYGIRISRGERDRLLYPLIKDKVRECYDNDNCDANGILDALAEQPWDPSGAAEGVTAFVRQSLAELDR
jgi:hypothetical protein